MTDTRMKALVKRFKIEVHAHAIELDHDGEMNWNSFATGWAMAKGIDRKEALEFATYLNYYDIFGVKDYT